MDIYTAMRHLPCKLWPQAKNEGKSSGMYFKFMEDPPTEERARWIMPGSPEAIPGDYEVRIKPLKAYFTLCLFGPSLKKHKIWDCEIGQPVDFETIMAATTPGVADWEKGYIKVGGW